MSTTTLNGKVSLHNILDAEKFVQHCMNKARGIVLSEGEREELLAEGLCILVELSLRYDPDKDRSADEPTKGFFGYALYLLPRKLGDAWHRSNPTHLLRTHADGIRRYEYVKGPRSLDQVIELGGSDGTADGRVELHTGNTRSLGDFISV